MSDSLAANAPPAASRDGLTALLLLAVIGAALLLGYHQTPAPVAVAVTSEPVAVVESAPAIAEIGTYDLNVAMALAGNEVPSDHESYYFFAFVEEVSAEQEIGDLSAKLQQAAKEHDFLGIAGPDPERNRRNLLSALNANEGQDLTGAVIIYVGPAAQQDELSRIVQATGAQFRFVSYPGPGTVPLPKPSV